MKKFVMLGTIILIMLCIGSVAAVSPNIVENNYVTVDQAREQAQVAHLDVLLTNLSGDYSQNWNSSIIGDDPIKIEDINGLQLFYLFPVLKNGQNVGDITVASSKIIGTPIFAIKINPRSWNVEDVINNSQKLVLSSFPNCTITSSSLVYYDYPKLGVMEICNDPHTGNDFKVIVDIAFNKIIFNSLNSTTSENVSSFYDILPSSDYSTQLSNWEAAYEKQHSIQEDVSSTGLSLSSVLNNADLNQIKTVLPSSIIVGSSTVVTNMYLHVQEDSVWCIPATAQMIDNHYTSNYDSQTKIAGIMGVGHGQSPTYSQELQYYKGTPPNGMGKTGSVTYTYPAFSQIQSEINAGRPLDSWYQIVGGQHARACSGYGSEYSTGFWIIQVYDPWPNNGVYWEYWANGDPNVHDRVVFVKN